VFHINVPPLRERREDIPVFIEYFRDQICKQNNLSRKEFTPATIGYLSSLIWPGNVRELRNTVERMIILSDSEIVDKSLLKDESPKFSTDLDKVINSASSLHEFQDKSEKIFIEKKLAENNWNISKTAEILNIQRSHLYTKIKQYHIEIPSKEDIA
jgi:two-component system nitrogen regulation response regulator NtrX